MADTVCISPYLTPFRTAHGVIGTVRKALGLSFIGETRESEKRYIADVRLKGFSEKDLHFFTFGQSGEKSYA